MNITFNLRKERFSELPLSRTSCSWNVSFVHTMIWSLSILNPKWQGKPVSLAKRMDIPRAVLNLRAFASGQCHLLETSNQLNEEGVINYTSRSPTGVAGLIAPWNLPLYLLTFKLAPALMAGCTVVCKPSEMTTVTAWMLCKVYLWNTYIIIFF